MLSPSRSGVWPGSEAWAQTVGDALGEDQHPIGGAGGSGAQIRAVSLRRQIGLSLKSFLEASPRSVESGEKRGKTVMRLTAGRV